MTKNVRGEKESFAVLKTKIRKRYQKDKLNSPYSLFF
jgi:hypothetical protein